MRKLRFLWALIATFIRRFKVVILSSTIIGVVLFLLFHLLYPRLYPPQVSYIGYVGRYHVDELPSDVLSLIGEGLTKVDATGLPVPGLASSWTPQENGKTWIFKMDNNRRWHDGTRVTAQSIQYSFDNVLIERPDDQTLVFKLQNAYAPFPVVVAHATFARGLIGTGEWKVNNISIKSNFVDELTLTNSIGEKKIIRFYPNENAAKVAFELGHVDVLQDLLDTSPFDSWRTAAINNHINTNRYVAVFFNQRSQIFKENKSLRQALSYAIDKSVWSGNIRALGPIPSQSWAYNSQIKPYDYDVTRAKELLEPSIPKDGQLRLKLTTTSALLPIAEKIAKDWKAVNVVAEVQAANELPEDYDAYLVLYEVSLDPDQYLTWHSTQDLTNVTHYANQRTDKLLEDGRLEMDFEKRKKMYLDFQRFLLEDAPAAFLYHPTSFDITRK